MTAWIVNRDERLLEESVVEKTILDAIKTSMHSYSNQDIFSVNYIGRRDVSLPMTGNSAHSVKNVPNETTKKSIGSAGYTGIAAAVVALIVAVVSAAQSRRSRIARRRARLEIERNLGDNDSRSSLHGYIEEDSIAPDCSADSSEYLPAKIQAVTEPKPICDDSIWPGSDSDYSDCSLCPNDGAFPATTSPPPTNETQH